MLDKTLNDLGRVGQAHERDHTVSSAIPLLRPARKGNPLLKKIRLHYFPCLGLRQGFATPGSRKHLLSEERFFVHYAGAHSGTKLSPS